jgi:hypothetical protein
VKYTLDTWQGGTEKRGLSVAVAAGILAAGETVVVGAIAAEYGRSLMLHEAAPGLALSLYPNPLADNEGEQRFSVRSSATDLGPDEAATLQLILARADAIRVMAEKLLAGEDPGEYDEPAEAPAEVPALDRVIAEVADALGRYAGLDSGGLVLNRHQEQGLARAAMARLCTIRDRDGMDPLPHRDVPATEPGYDPVSDLAVIALAAMRTAAPVHPTAATGLLRLQRELHVDGKTAYPDLVLALRAAMSKGAR